MYDEKTNKDNGDRSLNLNVNHCIRKKNLSGKLNGYFFTALDF